MGFQPQKGSRQRNADYAENTAKKKKKRQYVKRRQRKGEILHRMRESHNYRDKTVALLPLLSLFFLDCLLVNLAKLLLFCISEAFFPKNTISNRRK